MVYEVDATLGATVKTDAIVKKGDVLGTTRGNRGYIRAQKDGRVKSVSFDADQHIFHILVEDMDIVDEEFYCED